jgi:Flp pilus assembly protein TadD
MAHAIRLNHRVGDVKSAITDLRRAVQLSPRDVALNAKLAFFLDFRGQQWLQVRVATRRSRSHTPC